MMPAKCVFRGLGGWAVWVLGTANQRKQWPDAIINHQFNRFNGETLIYNLLT
jgi:hypothetical protein